jgi:putative transposase
MELVLLRCRCEQFRELEIVVLRHELAILRRRVGRPVLRPADRALLAAASRLLPRGRWTSFFVTPETLVRWHRQLVARRRSCPSRRPGRPRVGGEIGEFVLRPARGNPRWGCQRIAGELAGLGITVSGDDRAKAPARGRPRPAWTEGGPSWRELIRGQAVTMLARDCFTVETVTLRRIYVLLFIERQSRRVHLAGATENPSGAWVAQHARNLAGSRSEREAPPRVLIRDHDAKFTAAFDEIFRIEGAEIVRTPIAAPRANAIAARFVGTVRRECLDWPPISGRPHLERVLGVLVDHDHGHRPHRALGLAAPDPAPPALRPVTSTPAGSDLHAGTGSAA